MYWDESELLLERRPGDRAAIERLDAFLHDRRMADVLEPRQLATALALREPRVVSLLGEYESVGVVRRQTMVGCPACETLSPADDVRRAREDGDEHPCVRGDVDLAGLDDLRVVAVFRLLSEPPPVIGR